MCHLKWKNTVLQISICYMNKSINDGYYFYGNPPTSFSIWSLGTKRRPIQWHWLEYDFDILACSAGRKAVWVSSKEAWFIILWISAKLDAWLWTSLVTAAELLQDGSLKSRADVTCAFLAWKAIFYILEVKSFQSYYCVSIQGKLYCTGVLYF